MPVASLHLADVYYEISGSGPALVFAHGAGGNALSWWQQTAFFSPRYTCITFDHPGFRHSSWKRPENDPEAFYGNVLAELLDYLEIHRAGLIAQSMGGWTCLRFAVDHPERVSSLVMGATDAGLCLPDKATYSEQEKSLEQIRNLWNTRQPGSFDPAAGSRMFKEQPELHKMYVGIREQNGGVSRRGWGNVNLGELHKLTCPTLLLVGEEDIICHPARMAAFAEEIPAPEHLVIPETGHSVYFERPELFNKAVDRFLEKTYRADTDGPTILDTSKNTD